MQQRQCYQQQLGRVEGIKVARHVRIQRDDGAFAAGLTGVGALAASCHLKLKLWFLRVHVFIGHVCLLWQYVIKGQ